MAFITSVQPIRNYMIKIGFDNGTTVTLNMEHKLNTMRFQQLRDRALFCSAVTDGYSIKWNELIEISITEIFEIAQMNS